MKNVIIREAKFFLITLLLYSLHSCMSLNDSWIDLGSGYTYHSDGKWKSIVPKSGYNNTAIYSEVLNYRYDDKFIIAIQKPDYDYYIRFVGSDWATRYHIYCRYLKDSVSNKFKQETTPFIRKSIKEDSSLYKTLKKSGLTDQTSDSDRIKIEYTLDTLFHCDSFYIKLFSSAENYWIIDKDNNIRYGPMTKSEFDKLVQKMKIDLKF